MRGVFLGDVCVLLGRSLYLGSVFCGLGRKCMYGRDVCVYQAVGVCFYSGIVFVVWAHTSIVCR